MTFGNVLYLVMAVGLMVIFSIVLAYQSWQQSRRGPDMIGGDAQQPDVSHTDHHGVVHA